MTDWRINEIAQIVEPDETQRAALEELKTAMAKAIDVLKAACPSDLPSTPTGRIEAMHVRLSALLEGVRTVRAPLAKLYELLTMNRRRASTPCPQARIRTSQNGGVTSAYCAASVRRGFLLYQLGG